MRWPLSWPHTMWLSSRNKCAQFQANFFLIFLCCLIVPVPAPVPRCSPWIIINKATLFLYFWLSKKHSILTIPVGGVDLAVEWQQCLLPHRPLRVRRPYRRPAGRGHRGSVPARDPGQNSQTQHLRARLVLKNWFFPDAPDVFRAWEVWFWSWHSTRGIPALHAVSFWKC